MAAMRPLIVPATFAVLLAARAAVAGDGDVELPSCERAVADYVEDRTAGPDGQRDLAAGEYGAVLNQGSYLNRCGVPQSMKVVICVAVQDGKAVGATVSTEPSDEGIGACVRNEVAALEYPSHPKMDIARTTFAPADEDQPRGDGAGSNSQSVDANAPQPVEPKKSGCGCALPGAAGGEATLLALSLLSGMLWLRRRER